MAQDLASFKLMDLVKCAWYSNYSYTIINASPATGILYITENSPYFLSGHLRLRGKNEGRYPYKYLEMLDKIFGSEPNTIEVCSRSVTGRNNGGDCFTVDSNEATNPDLVADAQTLEGIKDSTFSRFRGDPPYNEDTAMSMYGTQVPRTSQLLKAGARVCKTGSLLFLLLGPQNYQICPSGVRRVGWICCDDCTQ